jgi:hypothetical protein
MRQPYKEYLMKKRARVLVLGAAVLSLVIGFLAVASSGAADDKADLRATVQKIADAIQNKDMDQAKKLAQEVAKGNDVEDVMHLMNKRDAAGKAKVFGIGKKPNAINPDGIEAMIQNLSKKPRPQTQIEKESPALVEMAYRIAAIATIAHAKPPEKDEPKKKKADWMEWSADLEKTAISMADAAKAKKPVDVKNAAAKVNTTCNTCHAAFKDQ